MTGAVAAVVALCVGAASSEPSQGSSEIEQLKKEVAALRQRVESLEERLKADLTPPNPRDGKETPGIVNPSPGLRQVPPNGRRFEFNGMPYYVVPIDKTRAPASDVRK
jgi:hypothetical protein